MEKYEWLKDEIVDYITYECPAGALLITGEWGTGKTFAVERIAEDLEKEMNTNKYLFVSACRKSPAKAGLFRIYVV